MYRLFKRTPYAILAITLAFVFATTWIAGNYMGGKSPSLTTFTLPSESFISWSSSIMITPSNTYYIGAQDGLMYVYNVKQYNIQKLVTYITTTTIGTKTITVHNTEYPTGTSEYSPLLWFNLRTNSTLNLKALINEAMRNSYASSNSVIFYLLTYNPLIVAGADAETIVFVTTSTSGSTSFTTQTTIVNWNYNNTNLSNLSSFLTLNAYEINPVVYYNVAFAFVQLQQAKLAAFWYRYNIFLNDFDIIYLTSGTYTLANGDTITVSSTTAITFNYDYGTTTTYPRNATIAFPIFFNNQTFFITKTITEVFGEGYIVSYGYNISYTGKPYPNYSTFSSMLLAAKMFLKNFAEDDDMFIGTSQLSQSPFLTNIFYYTYTNPLYPTNLEYMFTGLSPEPFPAFNDAFIRTDTRITSYEYFMPLFPAFLALSNNKNYITFSNNGLVTTITITSTSTGTSGYYTQTLITYAPAGTATLMATVPIIISQGEATKTIIITLIPQNNLGTSWTTTITTTYRCITAHMISITMTLPYTIKSGALNLSKTVLNMSIYALVTITEEFPIYPTVPLLNVSNGTTTFVSPSYVLTSTVTTLYYKTLYPTVITTLVDGVNMTTTSITSTTTSILVTFTTKIFEGFTTLTQDDTFTLYPTIFTASFTQEHSVFVFMKTTTSITSIVPGTGAESTAITLYSFIYNQTAYMFTRGADNVIQQPTVTFNVSQVDEYLYITPFFGLPLASPLTFYSTSASLSSTTVGGIKSYVAVLSIYTSTWFPSNETVSIITRQPYVTAFLMEAHLTFTTSASTTSTIVTSSKLVTTTIAGVTTVLTSYYYTLHITNYYYITSNSSTALITYSTVSLATGTYTRINTTLTTTIQSISMSMISSIYSVNRTFIWYGELLATRIAALNYLVAYAGLDHYLNLLNIRNQWIISPTDVYYSLVKTYQTQTIVGYVPRLVNGKPITSPLYEYYYTYTVIDGNFLISTAYIDSFMAIVFKAPASPLQLFTTLLKINYPGIYGLDYTSYYVTTISGTNVKLTSTTFSNAAAFLLLSNTQPPEDNIVINLQYVSFTSGETTFTQGGTIIVLYFPGLMTYSVMRMTTYPVIQYYLSEIPYVYVLPLPTNSLTPLTLSYVITALSYRPIVQNQTFYLTTIQTSWNGNITGVYVQTSFVYYTTAPYETVVAYVSPILLGVYVLYGMTFSTTSTSYVIIGVSFTTSTNTAVTGWFWINNNPMLPWFQSIYVPVTVTTTYFFQSYTNENGTEYPYYSTLTVQITGYVAQLSQNVYLPFLTLNQANEKIANYAELIDQLYSHGFYPVYALGTSTYDYTFSNQPGVIPYYIISDGTSSWVIFSYIGYGTVPVISEATIINGTVPLIQSYLPAMYVAQFTQVSWTEAVPPTAYYGISPPLGDTNIYAIFYYSMPFYAAFFNMAAYGYTATTLPAEFRSIPRISYMYLPNSITYTTTYYVFSYVNGLPLPTSSYTIVLTEYYGYPLLYSFVTAYTGVTVYPNNPSPVPQSS